MTAQQIVIRLQTRAIDAEILRPETLAELTVIATSVLYRANTRVLGEDGGNLTLSFQEPVRKIQRRQKHRRPCTLPVMYRAIHTDGSLGGWNRGTTLDIGEGGIGLLLPPGSLPLPRMELWFQLPLGHSRLDGATRVGSNNGVLFAAGAQSPLKVAVRTAHSRPSADGGLIVGAAFTNLTPAHQVVLVQFVAGEASTD